MYFMKWFLLIKYSEFRILLDNIFILENVEIIWSY